MLDATQHEPVIQTSPGEKVSEILQLSKDVGESADTDAAKGEAPDEIAEGVAELVALYEKFPPKGRAALLLFLKEWTDSEE